MSGENDHVYYDALTGVGYEATLMILRKIQASPRLNDSDRRAIDKGIKLFQDIPERWPSICFFHLVARHEESGGSIGFEFHIDSDQLVIGLSECYQLEAGSESSTLFSFYYERGCPAEDFEGSLRSLDAFADEINPEYFEEVWIDFQ